ncbi:hypothetical protein MASR2M15_03490 [Anaerolineales bacterium]
MRQLFALILVLILLFGVSIEAQEPAPTLEDFWQGEAEWVLVNEDVGLPIGESDTVQIADGTFRSYLHASYQSAGILDSCGEPAPFPGCLTVWESVDGTAFELINPQCVIRCEQCPCDDARDHISAQQYPRVVQAENGMWYMAYEWHAQTILRDSTDGLNWSDWQYLRSPSGTWPSSYAPCSEIEKIGAHPNIRGEVHDCLLGAPPGIYVEGDRIWVFVTAGSAPSHMRCYTGQVGDEELRLCQQDPLFSGASEYGEISLQGAEANAFFDFRYVSSAEVVKVGEHYYMAYEGVRGPDALERGMDTQFGLGFARSVGPEIDGEWERYPHNPVIMDMGFNWGIGHADIVIVDGESWLYTASDQERRGRYILRWKTPD